MAHMQARWRRPARPGRGGAARGRGDGVRTVRPGRWQRARARAGGRKAVGSAAEERHVVLAVTAYGRQAGGPYFDRFKLKNVSMYPTLTDSNSKTLN
jgi:hypothetical protein